MALYRVKVIVAPHGFIKGVVARAGGGGDLGLEKGTNCSPTAAEQWLSRSEMAKRVGHVR